MTTPVVLWIGGWLALGRLMEVAGVLVANLEVAILQFEFGVALALALQNQPSGDRGGE